MATKAELKAEQDTVIKLQIFDSSYKIIKPPNTFNNSLTRALCYIGNKMKLKMDGSCLTQDKITFTHGKTVNIYIVYEINLWNYVDSSDPALGNSLSGAVELMKNADFDKYKYSWYGNGVNMKRTFFILCR